VHNTAIRTRKLDLMIKESPVAQKNDAGYL